MGPIWGRQAPCGPHVGPINFAVWVPINTPKVFLVFLLSCSSTFPFFSILKLEVKLNDGTSHIIMHLTISAILLKIPFYHKMKNDILVQVFLSYFILHFDFNAIIYTIILFKCLPFLWKNIFLASDTHPTQVVDMDPWPFTWPNLGNLTGWGQ